MSLFNSKQDANYFFISELWTNFNQVHIWKQKHKKLAFFFEVFIWKADKYFCRNLSCKMASVLPSYTNSVSFSSYPYKFGLIKTLIHYTYERSNSWSLFIEESLTLKTFWWKLCTLVIWLINSWNVSYVIDFSLKIPTKIPHSLTA